jgi:hypothetical protein
LGSVAQIAFLALTACVGGGQTALAARPPLPIHRDLRSLVEATPLIIVGRVMDIRPGRVAGSGEGQLQFNDVRVMVEKRLKGNPSHEVVVEQVDMSRSVVVSEIGPPYRRGERYLLFLERGEGDRYITVVQGRYLLKARSVHPLEPGPAADAMKGLEEGKALQAIAAIVGER